MEPLLKGNMNEVRNPFKNLALCKFSLKTRLLNTKEGIVCSVCVCVKVYQCPAAVSNPKLQTWLWTLMATGTNVVVLTLGGSICGLLCSSSPLAFEDHCSKLALYCVASCSCGPQSTHFEGSTLPSSPHRDPQAT